MSIPNKITSDNGTEFNIQMIKKFCLTWNKITLYSLLSFKFKFPSQNISFNHYRLNKFKAKISKTD